jgi:hypothetical protein
MDLMAAATALDASEKADPSLECLLASVELMVLRNFPEMAMDRVCELIALHGLEEQDLPWQLRPESLEREAARQEERWGALVDKAAARGVKVPCLPLDMLGLGLRPTKQQVQTALKVWDTWKRAPGQTKLYKRTADERKMGDISPELGFMWACQLWSKGAGEWPCILTTCSP